MRKMVLFAMTLACTPALADWVEVAAMKENAGSIYVDPTTIKKLPGKIRSAWELGNFNKPQEDGHLSYKYLSEFDCAEEKDRAIQGAFYANRFAKGDSSKPLAGPTEWFYVDPESPEGKALKYVCSQ